MDWGILKDVGIFVVGLVTGPTAYFVKRKIERRPEHENLELKERLLKINREMNDQNLTPEKLKDLEASLRNKVGSRSSPEETQAKIEAITEHPSGKIITQAEMNQTSYEGFEKADLALQQAYRRLRSILDEKDLERLDEAQEAWATFRDKQVVLAGGFYEGGSIRPLIHNVEAQAVTEARVKELHALYDELQSR